MLKGTGTDPKTGDVIAETLTTAVIRGAGGFGGQPGQRPPAPEFPTASRGRIPLPTREDQALIYRLSGDRNPLHSDPWFAQKMAGFPKPILHGLCTASAGRALVAGVGGGDASKIKAIAARFTSPVFPGETLTTSIWRTRGRRCFVPRRPIRTGPARLVLEDGVAEYTRKPAVRPPLNLFEAPLKPSNIDRICLVRATVFEIGVVVGLGGWSLVIWLRPVAQTQWRLALGLPEPSAPRSRLHGHAARPTAMPTGGYDDVLAEQGRSALRRSRRYRGRRRTVN